MPIDLTPADLKVLIVLLDRAGDEFSNHGCNDFNLLRDGGLTPGEAEELKSRMQVEFPGEEEAFDRDFQYDWLLFRRYEKLFKRALEAKNAPPVAPVMCQHCGEPFLPSMGRFHECRTSN
jgi:hypothetical protein